VTAKRAAARSKGTARTVSPSAKRDAIAANQSANGSSGGKPPAIPPKPPAGAEIVVRQGFVIDATGPNGPHAVPEVIVLANALGLRYLAEVFAHLADSARGRATGGSVTEVRMARGEHPVNSRMSDDLDFRFATLSDSNRRAAFKQFGIDTRSRQEGSLFERYQEVATQFGRLTAAMSRDQWRREHKSNWDEHSPPIAKAVAPRAAMALAEKKLTPVDAAPSASAGAQRPRLEMTTASLPSLPPSQPRPERAPTIATVPSEAKRRIQGSRHKTKPRESENVNARNRAKAASRSKRRKTRR